MLGNAICNTGPMIAMAMINRIGILEQIFSSVTIPDKVHEEILQGGETNIGVANYQKAKWIKVAAISTPIDPLLRTSLDAGEAAVIGLSLELNTDFTVIDERKARKIARAVYGLNVIGTARIMVEAKRMGLIENVGVELQSLRQSGYWIGDAIMDITLMHAGEK